MAVRRLRGRTRLNDSIAVGQSREERVDAAIAEYLTTPAAIRQRTRAEWLARHADLTPELEEFLADAEHFQGAISPLVTNDDTVEHGSDSSGIRPAPLPAGPIGDYEVLGEIARGGMGVVFKAR